MEYRVERLVDNEITDVDQIILREYNNAGGPRIPDDEFL